MAEFKSFFKKVAGNEGDRCHYSTRLDTYGCGCQHNCGYCLHPETPILMFDGSVKKIDDIKIGDEVYGVVKDGSYWRFCKSTVLNKWEVEKPSFIIKLSDGRSVICSGDHRWLSNRGWKYTTGKMSGPGRRPYLTTQNDILGIGQGSVVYTPEETEMYCRGYLSGMIRGDGNLTEYEYKNRQRKDLQYHFRLALTQECGVRKTARLLEKFGIGVHWFDFDMLDRSTQAVIKRKAIRTNKKSDYERIKDLIEYCDDAEYRRGFLAGVYDAEGGKDQLVKRVCNTNNDIFDFICSSLDIFGFKYRIEHQKCGSGRVLYVARLLGGISEFLRFRQFTGSGITGLFSIEGVALKSNADTRIVSIEPYSDGERLVDITTSTENFIANGLVSHNCYARSLLDFRKLWNPAYPSIANINKIRHTIRTKLKPGEIVRLGGMTDCFQPLERENRITLQTIQALNEMGVGYLIVTKSSLVAEMEYLKAMDKNLAHIQVSVTITDEKLCKRIEPGADSPEARMAAIETLQDYGFDVALRLSPFVPEFVDLDVINSVRCDKILVEFLRVNSWIRKWLTNLDCGVDLSVYCEHHSGYDHMPLAGKRNLISKITGFREVSVCEDVEGHQAYWAEHVNANPDDCCNLLRTE